ncbi:hypothetical protein JX265_012580 [Neoarthrinium moseri]|uniref:Benzoate 4-monooxygenase cytochrome P450 n=1 Tax=Neoarthrinium moseri TaxID=1658444 RepID=A0A9P9W9W9_9PEZI|nr:hypothetical protein JX265_012580 [Neoarthrinium moseri]
MLDLLKNMGFTDWVTMILVPALLTFVVNLVYNLFFHPLAKVPGPFLARATGIVSWYYALSGRRHLWIWQQFQIYGYRVRIHPNAVVFCDPESYTDIYSTKSNVRRSKFYTAWRRNDRDRTTLNSIDVAEHAHRRKLLNVSFTEKSLRAATGFIIKHVDRWHALLVDESGSDWSAPVDFAETVDTLVFDIMGDLCFGRSFNIKEPGENPLKVVPHNIAKYTQFQNPLARSPFLDFIVWLQPRGLEQILEVVTPPAVKQYFKFVHDSVTDRITLQAEQAQKPESERRQDMFYFLFEARDPDTGLPAYKETDIRAEANLLIIAGSDTTAISLTGIIFYLTGNPRPYEKLVKEIRTTFASVEDIVHGPKLLGCQYLKACIDEGMRLTPVVPSELSREVLPGGITIKGEYYPPGTIVGSANWASSRNPDVYPDADVFRPERWIVDEAAGVTKADVALVRSNFHPFASGPGNCVGKNLAMTELMITLARTLHRMDVRREPGSTEGAGAPELGWGARDDKQFHLYDAYISLRHGPRVQFRKRTA